MLDELAADPLPGPCLHQDGSGVLDYHEMYLQLRAARKRQAPALKQSRRVSRPPDAALLAQAPAAALTPPTAPDVPPEPDAPSTELAAPRDADADAEPDPGEVADQAADPDANTDPHTDPSPIDSELGDECGPSPAPASADQPGVEGIGGDPGPGTRGAVGGNVAI